MTIPHNKLCYWSYHRQRLGKKGQSPLMVLKDIIGVYSSHPTAPLSLFARTTSMEEQTFLNLDTQHLVVRLPAMRLSVYMLPVETAPIVFAATVPPASDPIWEKRYSQKGRAIPQEKYEKWKNEIIHLANEPLLAKEIKQAIDIPDEILKAVLNRMAFEGHLTRIGAKSLRSNIISYVATSSIASKHDNVSDPEKALEWLAAAYLKTFGPARIQDFQWWAGITSRKAEKAFSSNNTTIVDDGYFILQEDLNDFEAFELKLKDPIDILPQWDAYTMGYAPDGRARFVNADVQKEVYGALGATGGNALGTILLNGMALGVWNSKFKGKQMLVTLKMFDKPTNPIRKEVKRQFIEIAALLGAKDLEMQI